MLMIELLVKEMKCEDDFPVYPQQLLFENLSDLEILIRLKMLKFNINNNNNENWRNV